MLETLERLLQRWKLATQPEYPLPPSGMNPWAQSAWTRTIFRVWGALDTNPLYEKEVTRTFALVGAIWLNDPRAAEYLLQFEGVKADGVYGVRHRPLYTAIDCENQNMVSLLARYGANLRPYDLDKHNNNITPEIWQILDAPTSPRGKPQPKDISEFGFHWGDKFHRSPLKRERAIQALALLGVHCTTKDASIESARPDLAVAEYLLYRRGANPTGAETVLSPLFAAEEGKNAALLDLLQRYDRTKKPVPQTSAKPAGR